MEPEAPMLGCNKPARVEDVLSEGSGVPTREEADDSVDEDLVCRNINGDKNLECDDGLEAL